MKKKIAKEKTLVLRITTDTWNTLEKRREKTDVPISAFVRRAIEEKLERDSAK